MYKGKEAMVESGKKERLWIKRIVAVMVAALCAVSMVSAAGPRYTHEMVPVHDGTESSKEGEYKKKL